MRVLTDPDRDFASSIYIQLEVLPKAVYNKQKDEADFYNRFFKAVTHWAEKLSREIYCNVELKVVLGRFYLKTKETRARCSFGRQKVTARFLLHSAYAVLPQNFCSGT